MVSHMTARIAPQDEPSKTKVSTFSPLISEKENQELAIAVGAREDCRTFIAAQKAQSWKTTRWASR